MRRTATVLLAVLVVVGTVGAFPMTGVAQQTPDDSTETATSTDDGEANATAPGDVLEGVVGVQEAELAGEIENRAFGIRVANASTPAEKAQVIAEQHERNERRVAELQERKQELKAARENGTISGSEYRSEVAKLAVESRNVERLANGTANVSRALEERGIDVSTLGINTTAIARLANNASALTGPEVAEIARSIAGPSVAASASDGASERRGPPESAAGSAAERGNAPAGGNATAGGERTTDRPDGAGGGADSADGAGGGSDNAGGGSDAAGSRGA